MSHVTQTVFTALLGVQATTMALPLLEAALPPPVAPADTDPASTTMRIRALLADDHDGRAQHPYDPLDHLSTVDDAAIPAGATHCCR